MIRRLMLLALLAPWPAVAFELALPVACIPGTDCWIVHYVDHDPGPGAADSFCGPMTYDGHDGVDFAVRDGAAMRAGVDVLASAAGTVKAVRDGVPDIAVEQGGKAAVEGIDCGNGVLVQHDDGWETQYCHMRQDSIAVRVGDKVVAGDLLGLVGLSGMTSFPHLHLSVRKDGTKLDPFRGTTLNDACTVGGPSLWNQETALRLVYAPLVLPVLGIADGPVDSVDVWDGRADTSNLTSASPALVVFMGGYRLRKDDLIELTLTAPDGSTIVDHRQPQERDQARSMRFAGKKRPADGWQPGTWRARVKVARAGETFTQERSFDVAP